MTATSIPTRSLGTTGEAVSCLALGGYHIGIPERAEGIRLVHAAIDAGITFMDNAWEYHDGESEDRMGEALAQGGYRAKAFLMTKNCAHDRTAVNSMVKLEESLRRLRTDTIDLWQIHEVVWPDDPDRIFAPGGAGEAMLKAKEQGKVRFIGFTGHKSPAVFRRMLELAPDFPWDALQMPVSVFDWHFNSFQQEILPLAQARGIGVVGMKSLASGTIVRESDVTPQEAIAYSLSLPVSTLCVGVDSQAVLEQDLAIGRGFRPLPEAELERIRAKAYRHAWDGRHERFKVSHDFEGPLAREEHGLPLAAD
ncbi:MAG TPA: aldo/keto reductase [Thermomicrobiales bacterium]|nr:aldo/keto reductase [Thermomicrobiales bacterium]